MQKIWNADSQQYAYAINEDAMYQRILTKKRSSSKVINKMELGLMLINLLVGSFVLGVNLMKELSNPYHYAMVGILYASVIYIFWRRQERLKGENMFDRTMLGDLDHAIRNAIYRERLSYFAFIYAFPMFGVVWVSFYQKDKPVEYLVGIFVFFIIMIILAFFEHKLIHKRYRKRLEKMKEMLLNG